MVEVNGVGVKSLSRKNHSLIFAMSVKLSVKTPEAANSARPGTIHTKPRPLTAGVRRMEARSTIRICISDGESLLTVM